MVVEKLKLLKGPEKERQRKKSQRQGDLQSYASRVRIVHAWMHDRLVGIATESLEFPVNMNICERCYTSWAAKSLLFFNFSMFYSKIS